MIAASEINQNVSVVIPALAKLQVAVVLPYRHGLVNEPPNLSHLSAVTRNILVHEPDTTRNKERTGRTNSISRALIV